ncbi:MAG: AAA family ATPase [Clostridia bacterium]|nr:AAA family ATPase [Clostridia bacterium]
MGKFGKKNHVNLNPLSYNIMLLGESKVGKTSLIKEVCEQLVGDNGYMFLECGQERGADAIEGISYINCPEWNMDYDELTNSAGFIDVCEDIIENKTSDYPDLKVVIWDTYDHLINIAESESIRLWNRYCRENNQPEKIAKSINAAWGGFGKGEKKAMELMFDVMGRLRSVGVSTIVIGHVKIKEVSDVVSGETYQVLTSDQQQNYFNALKKNLHFLGLAYIDRQIVKEKTGKKNIVTKQEITKNKVSAETRKIKFRDDSYAVDSGSRFADIVPEIEMNASEFIKALTDAILNEQKKSGKSVSETKAEQDKIAKLEEDKITKAEKAKKEKKQLDEIVSRIIEYFVTNKTNIDIIKPILAKCKEYGYNTPKDIDNIDVAKDILTMIEE